jgi:hypothetical protein
MKGKLPTAGEQHQRLLNERTKTKMLIRVMIDERENETETLMLFPIDICAPVV